MKTKMFQVKLFNIKMDFIDDMDTGVLVLEEKMNQWLEENPNKNPKKVDVDTINCNDGEFAAVVLVGKIVYHL